MRFTEDLIASVRARAPHGLAFEDDEIIDALSIVVLRKSTQNDLSVADVTYWATTEGSRRSCDLCMYGRPCGRCSRTVSIKTPVFVAAEGAWEAMNPTPEPAPRKKGWLA